MNTGDLDKAYEEGQIASEQAYPRDTNPYTEGTADRTTMSGRVADTEDGSRTIVTWFKNGTYLDVEIDGDSVSVLMREGTDGNERIRHWNAELPADHKLRKAYERVGKVNELEVLRRFWGLETHERAVSTDGHSIQVLTNGGRLSRRWHVTGPTAGKVNADATSGSENP